MGGYLHVGKILEDKRLVEFGVEILPVDFCLILWLLVRQQIDFDEGVGQPGRPVGGGKVARLDHL